MSDDPHSRLAEASRAVTQELFKQGTPEYDPVAHRRAIEAQYWDGQEPAGAWHRHGPVEITPAGAVSADAGVAVAARYPDRFIRPDHQLTLQVQRFDLASSTAVVDIAFG